MRFTCTGQELRGAVKVLRKFAPKRKGQQGKVAIVCHDREVHLWVFGEASVDARLPARTAA